MRIIAFGLIALFALLSCKVKNSEKENTSQKELIYNEVDDNGNKILKGEINEEVFSKKNYAWYQENYDDYPLDLSTINAFKNKLENIDITVFMGTWCSDSHRETPHFFKILEKANYPNHKIKMYAVDRSKKSLNGEEQGKNITHVPTFIFYKDGKEIGRIVESPIQTLEKDIEDIVNGTPKTPNYTQK